MLAFSCSHVSKKVLKWARSMVAAGKLEAEYEEEWKKLFLEVTKVSQSCVCVCVCVCSLVCCTPCFEGQAMVDGGQGHA